MRSSREERAPGSTGAGTMPNPRSGAARAVRTSGRSRRLLLPLAVAVALAGAVPGCAGTGGVPSAGGGSIPAAAAAPSLPPLRDLVRIVRDRTGAEVELEELVGELSRADVVFIGETHLDEVTHRTELALLEGVIAATDRRVVLALEMFTRADQPAIDRYLAGEIDEAAFLAEARAWPNYRTDYRPLIECARASGIPVVGSNLAPAARRKLATGGKEAYAALTEEERHGVARELHPNSPEYWERFDRTVRGHGAGFGDPDPEARLHSIQSYWDNTMGESCALALARHPGHVVLHINGGFHTSHGLGTAEQLRIRAPGARVVTVQIEPVGGLADVEFEPGAGDADFIVFAEARARSHSEGTHAVFVPRELRYRLHVPHGSGPWPLLIWCPDEDSSAEDEETRWRLLLGREAAIAVVEPPYPMVEEDLHVAARYTLEESFFEDAAAIAGGIERTRTTISRQQPVLPDRVVLAGEGEGGRIAALARYADRGGPPTLAIAPGPPGRLAEGGLPDPRPSRGGELLVLAAPRHAEAWTEEVAARAEVGFPGRVLPFEEGGTGLDDLREILGLPPEDDDAPLRTLWLSHGSALARQWALLAAARLGGRWRIEVLPPGSDLPDDPRDGSLWLETDLTPVDDPTIDRPLDPIRPRFAALDLAEGAGIPLPPGPFGGTVVLVLPAEVADDRRAAWRKLAEDDVTRRRNRFVGVRLAENGTDRDLARVLAELRAEGKSVVRIAPVRFCATAAEMRALRAIAEAHGEGLRISWSPGLGGELWRVLEPSRGAGPQE